MANFSKLYEQYVEQVYCFLRGLSGDDGLAEELTWKTFYQAFLHVDSFENRSGVFEWLCNIGESVYLKETKRRRRNFFERKRQIPAFEGEVPEGEVNTAERKKWIRRGLRKIRQRWICSILAVTVILLVFVGAALIVGGALKK